MGKRRGHGEGTIYQRESDGKWCANVDLGWHNGKRRRKVVYGKTRKEVADKLKALQRDQATGMIVVTEALTVSQYLARWLDDVVKQRNKPRTHASYREMVRLHINPAIGHLQLTKLSPAHVQAMLSALLAKELSPRTVTYARAILRRALNQALRWNLVARNAAVPVEPPRVERVEREVLTVAQARQFLAAIQGHRYELLYRLALSLGMRRGEILGLRWSDIDFAQAILKITGSLQRIDGQLVRSTPKTTASVRKLPLPAPLLRALEAHRDRQLKRWPGTEYVFLSTHGTPIDPARLRAPFKEILAQAGLPEGLRFHDLRHSCATLLIVQGVHPRVIKEILGHAQISTTMDIYGHVLDDTLREATDALGALLDEDS